MTDVQDNNAYKRAIDVIDALNMTDQRRSTVAFDRTQDEILPHLQAEVHLIDLGRRDLSDFDLDGLPDSALVALHHDAHTSYPDGNNHTH